MKKSIVILPYCLLIILNSNSQKIADKNFFDISIGPSFPVGDYNQKNLQNEQSGFAKTGQFVVISYGHKIGKYFGFGAMFYGQRNPIDTRSLGAEFSRTNFSMTVLFGSTTTPPPPPPPGAFTVYPNWEFEKSSWRMGSILIGGYWDFPFQNIKNLAFLTRAMFGIIYISSPMLQGNSITDTATARIDQNSVSGFGFSYLVRGELKYNLNRKINIHLSIDYLATNRITFHDLKTTFLTVKNENGFPSVAQAIITRDGKQTIQSLNPGLGIGFSF